MTGRTDVPASSPRAVVNACLRPERVPPPAGTEVYDFHRHMPGYRPTPLHRLGPTRKWSVEQRHAGVSLPDAPLAGGGVFVKDESDRFGLPAFKILGASWAVEQTVRTQPGTRVLIAASAGNHGRAVARAAAQRSLRCRIYLPAATSESRARLIESEGAEVARVDGSYDDAVAAAERAAEADGTALVADTALSPGSRSAGWVVDGYSTMFREISDAAPVPFGLVLVPAGVGSLSAAAVRWAMHQCPSAAVIAVEPVTASCLAASLIEGKIVTVPTPGTGMAGLDCATPSIDAWPTLRDGLTGTIAVSDAEAQQAMRLLAQHGLTIGDCGAAAFAALIALATDDDCAALRAAVGLGSETHVLCIGSEGASNPAAYAQVLNSVSS